MAAVEALPKVITDVITKAPPEKALKDLLPAIEAAADIAVPGVGIGIAVAVFALEHSKPPTPEEQQRMWDRAQGER